MKQSEIKQQAIIEAATQVFGEDGYGKATMKKIAEVSGVSKRTLYKHFPTKEQILMAVLDKLAEKSYEMAALTFDKSRSVEDQLEYIIRGKIAAMQDSYYRKVAAVTLPIALTDNELFKKVASNMLYKIGPLTTWLEQAKDEGLLKAEDISLIGNLIQGVLEKYAFWSQLLGVADEMSEQNTDKLVSTIIAIVKCHFISEYQS